MLDDVTTTLRVSQEVWSEIVTCCLFLLGRPNCLPGFIAAQSDVASSFLVCMISAAIQLVFLPFQET